MQKLKILLAEDDMDVANFVRKGLESEGHSVEHFSDGRDALTYALYNNCDVGLLDRMLPGMDGIALVKALRAAGKNMPVMFLTAMADVENRVRGLMAGGDDYLAKPFHMSELIARIIALGRRREHKDETTELSVHDLKLDLLSRGATRNGTSIELQNKEFQVLEALMRNEGRVISKTMLIERIWNFNFDPGTTVLETHMSRLRAKVDKPFGTQLIHTIRNAGYSIHGPR